MRSPDLVAFPSTHVAVVAPFGSIAVILMPVPPATEVIHTPPDQMYKIADWGQ